MDTSPEITDWDPRSELNQKTPEDELLPPLTELLSELLTGRCPVTYSDSLTDTGSSHVACPSCWSSAVIKGKPARNMGTSGNMDVGSCSLGTAH